MLAHATLTPNHHLRGKIELALEESRAKAKHLVEAGVMLSSSERCFTEPDGEAEERQVRLGKRWREEEIAGTGSVPVSSARLATNGAASCEHEQPVLAPVDGAPISACAHPDPEGKEDKISSSRRGTLCDGPFRQEFFFVRPRHSQAPLRSVAGVRP